MGSHPWKSFLLSLEGETSTWNSWLTFLSLERTRSKHSLPTAKTRLHTKPARLTFFREVKPKVDCNIFHLWIFLCQLPSTVASVSEREGCCMLRLSVAPPFPSLPAPLLKHSSPTSVLKPSSSSSSSQLLPGRLAPRCLVSSQQLQQQNVDF